MAQNGSELEKIHALIHQPSYALVYPETSRELGYPIEKRIIAYKDKAVEEVLDRLEKHSDGLPCTVRYSDGSVERMRVVPLSAIQAERNKLKEAEL